MNIITTSLLFLLAVHVAATGTSSGRVDFWKAFGKFTSGAVQPKRNIDLLQNDDYCGDNCCSSADALSTMDKFNTLYNTAEDPDTGLCFFNGSLYDEIIAPFYMSVPMNQMAVSTTMPDFDMKAAWKYAIENSCLQAEMKDLFAHPFPGGAVVIYTLLHNVQSVPARAMYLLNEDCQLTLSMHNYQSCYIGCAGIVAECPSVFPLPHQNATPEESANLYDNFMCFDVTNPPEGANLEDLCDDDDDDDQGEDDDGQ